MTNREYAETPEFVALCESAGIKATTRQASKYRSRQGLAYKTERKGDK